MPATEMPPVPLSENRRVGFGRFALEKTPEPHGESFLVPRSLRRSPGDVHATDLSLMEKADLP